MDRIISAKMKLLRERSGYTQKQIADFLNMPCTVYANYESAHKSTPLPILEAISILYGLDVCDFIDVPKSIQAFPKVSAYSADLSPEDMKQLSEFNDIISSYTKMMKLLGCNVRS